MAHENQPHHRPALPGGAARRGCPLAAPKAALAGCLLALVASACSAADSASIELATGNQSQWARVGLQWQWGQHWFSRNGHHLGGYWDLTAAQWRSNQYQDTAGASQNMTDIGITPVLRLQRDDKKGFYGEAGIGAHLLSKLYDNNGRRLSTHFQFGDHIGFGYVTANQVDVGLKIQHFSNGGYHKPNDGINFVIFKAGYAF